MKLMAGQIYQYPGKAVTREYSDSVSLLHSQLPEDGHCRLHILPNTGPRHPTTITGGQSLDCLLSACSLRILSKDFQEFHESSSVVMLR